MLAGPPGAGKSTLALSIAVLSGVPTLYASMDTHEATMALRTTAMLTGLSQHEVETRIQADPTWASDVLSRQHTSHGCSMPPLPCLIWLTRLPCIGK
jgi:cytidylate kinase